MLEGDSPIVLVHYLTPPRNNNSRSGAPQRTQAPRTIRTSQRERRPSRMYADTSDDEQGGPLWTRDVDSDADGMPTHKGGGAVKGGGGGGRHKHNAAGSGVRGQKQQVEQQKQQQQSQLAQIAQPGSYFLPPPPHQQQQQQQHMSSVYYGAPHGMAPLLAPPPPPLLHDTPNPPRPATAGDIPAHIASTNIRPALTHHRTAPTNNNNVNTTTMVATHRDAQPQRFPTPPDSPLALSHSFGSLMMDTDGGAGGAVTVTKGGGLEGPTSRMPQQHSGSAMQLGESLSGGWGGWDTLALGGGPDDLPQLDSGPGGVPSWAAGPVCCVLVVVLCGCMC